MINEILSKNNIDSHQIGRDYTMQDIIIMLTENYLVRQNLMSKTKATFSTSGDLEAA